MSYFLSLVLFQIQEHSWLLTDTYIVFSDSDIFICSILQCTHVIVPYLIPVNGTAVNKSWELAQPISKGISNRTECHNNVQVLFTACHKEGKQSQRAQLQVFITSLGNGTYCLGKNRWNDNFIAYDFIRYVYKIIGLYSNILPLWFLVSHLWQKDWEPLLYSRHCPRLLEKLHLWSEHQLSRTLSSVLSPQHFLATSLFERKAVRQSTAARTVKKPQNLMRIIRPKHTCIKQK